MDNVCKDEGQLCRVPDTEDTTPTEGEIVSNRNARSPPSPRTTSSADSASDAQQDNGLKKVSTFQAEDYGEAPPPLTAYLSLSSFRSTSNRAQSSEGPQQNADNESSMGWPLRMSLGKQYAFVFLSLNAFYALRWFGRSMYVLPVLALGLNFIIGYLFCLLGSSGIEHGGDKLTWYFNGTAADAFAIFIYVGGFALSLTAILFSLCIVAFQVASVTYSSRMLTGLSTRRSTKLVVSIFLGTFAYTFAGILSTETTEDDPFVPSVAVNVLVLYVIATVLGLVYYLHYVVTSLRISKLMDDVALETERAMARFHAPLDTSADRRSRKGRWMGKRYETDFSISQDLSGKLPDVPKEACEILADGNGYLIGVSETALVRMAQKWAFTIRILPRPGTYITKHSRIAWIWFYRQESDVCIHYDVQVARKLQFVLANIGFVLLRQLASAGNEYCRTELESRIALVKNHMKVLLKMARKNHAPHDYNAIKYATKKCLATLKKGKGDHVETQVNTSLATSEELDLWENAGPDSHGRAKDVGSAEDIALVDSFVDVEE
ncbi:Uncharacterized protein FVE85_8851 [Porphyridium purpureum]|uniref:Uncharacterized protein n=1 Tax=Porphyridium purpureum TaxID=35688 RepID=A0A5J4YQ23_PORPP|nr:Uncharacterized protein FVE85_8851 [Porphyridium purpureum]|eukprot:POR4264..scf296_7